MFVYLASASTASQSDRVLRPKPRCAASACARPWTMLTNAPDFIEYLDFIDNVNHKNADKKEIIRNKRNKVLQEASPSRIMCWFTDPKNEKTECVCGECKPYTYFRIENPPLPFAGVVSH